MGAKGLLYYCWHGGLEFPGGVLAPPLPNSEFHTWKLGDPLALTDHYEHVQRINTHILAWEPYLLNATSVGAWLVPATAGALAPGSHGNVASLPTVGTACAAGANPAGCVSWPQTAPAISDVRNEENMGPTAGLGFLLGQFRLGDGRIAVMLQNQDDRFVALPNVTFAPPYASMHCCQVSSKDGRERTAMWGFPWGRVDPGGAALYVFSSKPCQPTA
jgi:hypothetical protein